MKIIERRGFAIWLKSIVALMALGLPAYAQHMPRMVLCLNIDQMREDYLQELSPLLSKGGFNTILSNGTSFRNIKFPYLRNNRALAITSIFTGSDPIVSGISYPTFFDVITHRQVSTFLDNNYNGIYVNEGKSPTAIQRSTFIDILKSESSQNIVVNSVASYSDAAIISAGHRANGAFWIDDNIGSWGTSSYYKGIPEYIAQYNRGKDGLNNKLVEGRLAWKPLSNKSADYLQSIGLPSYDFEYKFNSKNIYAYKRSRLVNDEVTELATKIIENTHSEMSVLSITLDASVYPYSKGEGLNPEIADKYIGIDKNISQILNTVDKTIGLDNCLILLCSTGYFIYNREALEPKHNSLVFDTVRAEAIINMYLSALYGQGNWVSMLRDGSLSLNTRLIQEKRISLQDIQRLTARILKDMKGIDLAVSSDEIKQGLSFDERSASFVRGIYPSNEVDVYWTLKEGYTTSKKNVDVNVNRYATSVPALFVIMGQQQRLKSLPIKVNDSKDISKVISWVLRIRPPNG